MLKGENEKRIALFCGIPLFAVNEGRIQVRPIFWRVGLLAKALIKKGYRVKLYSPSYDYYRSEKSATVEGIEIIHIGLANLPFSPFARKRPSLVRYLIEIFRSLKRTASELRKFKPERVHIFTTFAYSIVTGLLLMSRGYKTYIDVDDAINGQMTANGYPAFLVNAQRIMDYFLPRFFLGVTVCSSFLKEKIGDKARIIPNMASSDFFFGERRKKDSGPVTAVMVGSVDGIQGQDNVIRHVIPSVLDKFSDIQFIFVGEGRKLAEMQELAGASFADKVKFSGYLDHKEVARILSSCDIGLLPLEDTTVNHARCPLKLFEYQASGLAVVATAIGEARRLIRHGITGYLIAKDDWGKFAEGIVRLAEDRRLRELITAGAEKEVQKYREENMTSEWINFWGLEP
jgi:glycosyltransferase involved in cell wall biosynthesis